jgi:class I fructose-bisphosphate aldolase
MILRRKQSYPFYELKKMSTHNNIRLNRIFKPDGKSVIAALDHGIAGITPLAHLALPRELLPEVIQNGADAIITTPGIARQCSDLFAGAGLILRIDGGPSALTGDWNKMELIRSIEDALRLGADAVIMMGITGTTEEARSLATLGRVAAQCQAWGMPLVAEMLPGGFTAKEVSFEQLMVSARLAAELGADIVKMRYQGPAEEYCAVVQGCFLPLVVLGGSKQQPDQLIQEVQQALGAGASGVAVGRNIWQSDCPGEITSRLAQTVHQR